MYFVENILLENVISVFFKRLGIIIFIRGFDMIIFFFLGYFYSRGKEWIVGFIFNRSERYC